MTAAAPYIGITGVVDDEDVDVAAACAALVPPPFRFMAGVLVSQRTLRGELPASRRYPALESARACVAELAACGCWPVVHYNSRATGGALLEELERLVARVPALRGVQLNVESPDPGVVRAFARAFPAVEVILQVNHAAVRPWAGDVHRFVAAFPDARHALLDASAGSGTPADPAWLAGTLRGWRGATRPGVAGGLGPDCAPLLRRVRTAAPGVMFSTDAETGVRVPVDLPTPGAKHQDRLDRARALAYVRACVAALTGDLTP